MIERLVSHLRNIPIGRKLMIMSLTACVIVLGASSTTFVMREAQNLLTAAREDIKSTADIIAKNTASALLFNDRDNASETMAGLSVKKGVLAALLLNADGELFARYTAPSLNGKRLPFELSSVNASPLSVRTFLQQLNRAPRKLIGRSGYDSIIHPVMLDGQSIGSVIILADTSGVFENLLWAVLTAIVIMGGSSVLAYFLSSRFQRIISTPILRLVDLMKSVSDSKNFSVRADIPGDDEIGLLCAGFNEMLCEIEERDQILKQRQAHLQQLAHFDTLTHLPNRTLFYDRLTQAILHSERCSESLAVLFIDLDHFKDVNDTMGHRFGDMLLVETAKRMASVTRGCDTVARLGGDEFTIFLQNIGRAENACLVAEKIQDILTEPFRIEGKELFITASIGITIYPDDGSTVDELLMNADIAMYHAKEQGKNSFKLFEREMTKHTSDRVSLQTDMRLALERGEFFLLYQPKIELATGAIRSVEALIRWKHPKIGVVTPNIFIPLAEETGFIIPLTEWVLRSACTQARNWQDAGHPPIRVAVNMSPSHFKRQSVVESVKRALETTSLPPRLLEIELTESSLIQNNEYTLHALGELKRLGVTIAIDDFGTGYSSLSYLHRFPIDTLKIDRSFVWNMNKSDGDQAIVNAIIAMAESLRIGVVAEGVETVDQLRLLREQGCHEIQGYIVSHPVSEEKVALMFASRDHLAPLLAHDSPPHPGETHFIRSPD